jgi:hypothetical protein
MLPPAHDGRSRKSPPLAAPLERPPTNRPTDAAYPGDGCLYAHSGRSLSRHFWIKRVNTGPGLAASLARATDRARHSSAQPLAAVPFEGVPLFAEPIRSACDRCRCSMAAPSLSGGASCGVDCGGKAGGAGADHRHELSPSRRSGFAAHVSASSPHEAAFSGMERVGVLSPVGLVGARRGLDHGLGRRQRGDHITSNTATGWHEQRVCNRD